MPDNAEILNFSRAQYEQLLNDTTFAPDNSAYALYRSGGGALPYGTWLRKTQAYDFETRRLQWNDTWLKSADDSRSFLVDAEEKEPLKNEEVDVIINEAVNRLFMRLVNGVEKLEGSKKVLRLDLPPLNEAEFLSKIVWHQLYPEEPVEDQKFIEFFTDLFYKIADSGKLLDALRKWIANKLVGYGKAANLTEADKLAQQMLTDYDDYNDLLSALKAPVVEEKEEQQ